MAVVTQESVTVARAPGRLDVMGGIADYGGSLVLQLPLLQGCHVAAQLAPTPLGGLRNCSQRLQHVLDALLNSVSQQAARPEPGTRV